MRLWYRVRGTFRFIDYTYQAANIVPGTPEIVSPTADSTLSGSVETFRWRDNASPVTEWWLYVGSSQGGSEHFDSGSLGLSTEIRVATLPTDGSTVYVRLWYRISGAWQFRDEPYIAAGVAPAEWSTNSVPVDEWWIHASSTPGGAAYYDSRTLGSQTQTTVVNLPTDGSQVFIRLWFRHAALWPFTRASGS